MSCRPARPSWTLLSSAVLLGSFSLLAARAVPASRRRADPPSVAGTTVPDLVGRHVLLVDKLAGDAGVVAVLSYRPRARQAPGTVVAVHPAAGAVVGRGSTIQVSVAGRPGTDLDDRIAADRRRFVGLGTDPDGTLVVVVAAGVNPDAAVAAIRPALAGRKHRVVTCDTSFAELESVRAGVSAVLLQAAGYTLRVDPAACAVRVEGDVTAEVAAALTERYGRAVQLARGKRARRSA
ncbi:PASTA domain-containing protein [Actinoplanes sp. NPDC049599]|uniref:PASTA domain-containing protein n=1 Tax=Actinoplanes sp. NPDC049599 TaxID=3363903 RepID=UPI0037873801